MNLVINILIIIYISKKIHNSFEKGLHPIYLVTKFWNQNK
jgi:hypothetical protein